jgi:hypothetical protein
MSLIGDTVVYVLVLIAVLAVVGGIMYGVAHLWKPAPEEPHIRATRAYQDALGQGPGSPQSA